VVLRAYNESLPGGVSATGSVARSAFSRCFNVASGSVNPSPPYLSWATAAANIQQAMDAAGRALKSW